jgi:hypothetical protein
LRDRCQRFRENNSRPRDSSLNDRGQLKSQASNQKIPTAEESAEIEAPDSKLATHNGPILSGWEQLGRVVMVDQSALGKTPRSNPAVYMGAFDAIRELFAQTDLAGQRGLKASAFSFNSREGQCERCRGAGFEKIEMQFLSDIFIRCPDCNGRRYRPHILEVKLTGRSSGTTMSEKAALLSWSVADILEATVDDAIVFLLGIWRFTSGATGGAKSEAVEGSRPGLFAPGPADQYSVRRRMPAA